LGVLANLMLRWALLVKLAGTYLGNEVSGSRQRHGYSFDLQASLKLGGCVNRSPTTYRVAICRRQLCRHSMTYVYLFATRVMYI
jgi:hypothetical protein